jgi:predicted small secreted protein
VRTGWAFENCPTLVVTQVMLFKVDHSSYKVLHCMKKKKKTFQDIEQSVIDFKK